MTDKETGQKYEKYYAEVTEVGNEVLQENAQAEPEASSYFDEAFEDEYEDQKIPQTKNYPKASDEELADTSSSRWLMYDGLAKLLNSKGMQGRPCILRAICESSEEQFTHHGGLFSELLHIIFT